MSCTLSFMHSCSTEDALIQKDSNIQTVSREQAIQFLQQNPLKGSGNKTSKTTTLSNYDAITLEKITNSDQLLTVISLPDSDKKQNSRVLLLTVNDTLKSAVFSMYPDVAQSTKEFSGRVLITSMSGDFFKGFRMKNGYLISKFIKKSSAYTTNKIESKSTTAYATEPIELQEVIIPARKPVQSLTVAYLYVYSNEIESSNGSLHNWGFGGGGGGGGEEEEVADPCDQIKKQMANPAYKAKLDILKSQTGQIKENGYAQNKDGTFTTLTANGPDAIAMPRDPNRVGYMHTHLDPYQKTNSDGDTIDVTPIKMFSPADVQQFLILVVNAQNYGTPISDAYGMMVSSAGIYQLAFTGNVADINAKNSTINWGRSLDNIYVKYLRKNGEEGFLKFLKDKIGIDGIELYKVEDSGNSKIALDSNGKIVAINCN
ncbi:hypothetical protein IWX83_000806 [Flavobacterium sp. CG_9.1]|uniref:hypothetical protein n=1 Tax=Flavobacterium sp. CG_9.1 TaxID=2787728 RepID=UPI0018C9B8F2|nr:hypothetical protein [Flavobacterium sp. CG_9.1]MBG6061032.1 hypothetical protein [Flavobacterium sp. CG_9.1]